MLPNRSIPVLEGANSIDEHLHTGGVGRLPVHLVMASFALCTLLGTLSVLAVLEHHLHPTQATAGQYCIHSAYSVQILPTKITNMYVEMLYPSYQSTVFNLTG
jgi:hypothetical protein